MKDKVEKIFGIAVKFFPGPNKNPSLRYKRMELSRDIILVSFPATKVEEANKILLKVDD